MIEVAEMQRIHAAVAGRRDELRRTAEAQIVETLWGVGFTRTFIDPRPFWAERLGDPPERLRRKRPKGFGAEYGVDAEGRAVLARLVDGDEPVTSEWLRLERGGVWFHPELHAITFDARERGRLLAWGECWGDSWTIETYGYDHDRVVTIDSEAIHPEREAPLHQRFELAYDDRGLLKMDFVYPRSGHRGGVWVRLDQPIGKELAELHDLLVAEVGPICEPGRVVALHYDAENPLAVGVEVTPWTEVEDALDDLEIDALYPANWELDERPLGEALRTRLEAAGGYLRVKGHQGKARKLLYGVCRELNARAPDAAFVFAAEVGGERLDKDLKESLLPAQLARLP